MRPEKKIKLESVESEMESKLKSNPTIARQQSDSSVKFLSLPIKVRWMIYHYLIPSSEILICPKKDRRHLEILGTNRQINTEASQVLYQQTILILTDEDIRCIPKTSTTRRVSHSRDMQTQTWRHNPFLGIGTTTNNIKHYAQPPHPGPLAKLEPHVIANFLYLTFDISLDFLHLKNNGPDKVTLTQTANLQSHFRKTSPFPGLIRILANSPLLKGVDIIVSIRCYADYFPVHEGRSKRNVRVQDVIVQSGAFNVLRDLKNVEALSFKFTDYLLDKSWDLPRISLTEISSDILKSVKREAESSLRLPQAEAEAEDEGEE